MKARVISCSVLLVALVGLWIVYDALTFQRIPPECAVEMHPSLKRDCLREHGR